MILSEQLKKLMSESEINQSELSRATNIPVQTLHNWLCGSQPKSIKQLKLVADYFDVSIDLLCFGGKRSLDFANYKEDINAGLYEVILRKVNSEK